MKTAINWIKLVSRYISIVLAYDFVLFIFNKISLISSLLWIIKENKDAEFKWPVGREYVISTVFALTIKRNALKFPLSFGDRSVHTQPIWAARRNHYIHRWESFSFQDQQQVPFVSLNRSEKQKVPRGPYSDFTNLLIFFNPSLLNLYILLRLCIWFYQPDLINLSASEWSHVVYNFEWPIFNFNELSKVSVIFSFIVYTKKGYFLIINTLLF